MIFSPFFLSPLFVSPFRFFSFHVMILLTAVEYLSCKMCPSLSPVFSLRSLSFFFSFLLFFLILLFFFSIFIGVHREVSKKRKENDNEEREERNRSVYNVAYQFIPLILFFLFSFFWLFLLWTFAFIEI